MLVFLQIVLIIYALACFWLVFLRAIPQKYDYTSVKTSITVVIPVRNEAKNIELLLQDLVQQTYPKAQFEVIVVDDCSDDNTVALVKSFQNKNSLNLYLIQLTEKQSTSPKKRAIEEAIKISNGSLIVTTDGDCRVGPNWLKSIAQKQHDTNAKLLSGPVRFKTTNHWFSVFQAIEFSSLIGTGACLIKAGYPTMCNGANLAYLKSVFEEVYGYEGINSIASGDDELLMAKIVNIYPDKIVFIENEEAIVTTLPQPNLFSFYEQRIRWASKWNVNKRASTMIVAIFVFVANLSFIITAILFVFNEINISQLLFLIILKLFPEFLFLRAINRFLNQKTLIKFIPLIQLIYPIYVVIFGILAQKKGYTWKNRNLN